MERWVVSAIFVSFLLFIILFTKINYSTPTQDSLFLLVMAQNISKNGLDNWVIASPASWGIFLPIIQSISSFLGEDYLRSLMPTFALSFLCLFSYMLWKFSTSMGVEIRKKIVIIIISLFVLITTPLFLLNFFYIHTNLISSVFFFAALTTFSMSSIEKEKNWLVFSMLAFWGFNLSRIENPIFTLVYFGMSLSFNKLSYKSRLIYLTPTILMVIFWYFSIARMNLGTFTDILDSSRSSTIALVYFLFLVAIIMSNFKWVEKRLLKNLNSLLFISLIFLLAWMFNEKPQHMTANLIGVLKNLFITGSWGAFWYLFLLSFLISIITPPFHYEGLFKFGIPVYFMCLLVLGFIRKLPYHDIWSDSANRMVINIMPIALLYMQLKISSNFASLNNHTIGTSL
ncbi:MAG TPA: hypothetical protein G4N92_02980 [Anaerolineae bacterium]|nr:hypothetical protein [Anaerolineae bacterium]